tara:strand:+ start:3786 stop:4796 length:1011 start_codon:yes stop_codon:yes gene_type:complete
MLHFDKQLITNSKLHAQKWQELSLNRRYFAQREQELVGNAITKPQPWLQLDSVTARVMRDNAGQVIMGDLMPLATTVNIGKIVHGYRFNSDGANTTQRSISGQKPQPMDKGNYDFRGVPVPIFTNGVGRSFREWNVLQNDDFDAWAEDVEKATYDMRTDMANYLLDGDPTIQFDGYQGYGIRNSPYTQSVDMTGIDLTTATTAEWESFLATTLGGAADDNLVTEPMNLYVSPEIARNLDLPYNQDEYLSGTRFQRLATNRRINEIKVDYALSGNEWTAFVPNRRYIRPVVGMPVGTQMMPRDYPMADYNMLIAGAMGFEIIADANGRSAVFYGSGA